MKRKKKTFDSAAGSLSICGTIDKRDIWLINLAQEFDRACDYFWTKTEEHRKINAEFRKKCSYINNKYASQ